MASNAQGKPSATDLTGSIKARLEEERKDEQQRRAEEITLIAQAKADEEATTVVDVTKHSEAPVVVDEVEVVESEDDGVVIRVNEDLQEVTIGDSTYNFLAGRKYKVPRNVAFHLEEKGRIWH